MNADKGIFFCAPKAHVLFISLSRNSFSLLGVASAFSASSAVNSCLSLSLTEDYAVAYSAAANFGTGPVGPDDS